MRSFRCMRGYVFASTHNKQQHALGLVAAVLRWHFTIRNACECMRVYVCVCLVFGAKPKYGPKPYVALHTNTKRTHFQNSCLLNKTDKLYDSSINFGVFRVFLLSFGAWNFRFFTHRTINISNENLESDFFSTSSLHWFCSRAKL